jgi:hypothetical protein
MDALLELFFSNVNNHILFSSYIHRLNWIVNCQALYWGSVKLSWITTRCFYYNNTRQDGYHFYCLLRCFFKHVSMRSLLLVNCRGLIGVGSNCHA